MSPTLSVDTVLLQHLLNFWDDRGINIAPVWRELGINAGAPLPPRIASNRLSLLLDELSAGLQPSSLVIGSGELLSKVSLPLTRILQCSETVQQGLPVALNFLRRQAGGVALECQHRPDAVQLMFIPAKGVSSSLAEVMLAWITAALIRCGCDRAGLILSVPRNAEHWQSHLGVAVSSGDLQLSVTSAVWNARLPGANLTTFVQLCRELERSQKKFEEVAGLYQELQQIVQECLERRMITQEAVADQVGLSVRNLQRRLKTLGTTYQNLLDESRQALAMRLVESSNMPLYEIAFMVGYAEPSAFYKAFRRWTGSTPGEYRQALEETADE